MSFRPFDIFRREIVIKGSYAEMTSFGAAIFALRFGRFRTAGIITHRFGLDDYERALDPVGSDDAAMRCAQPPRWSWPTCPWPRCDLQRQTWRRDGHGSRRPAQVESGAA